MKEYTITVNGNVYQVTVEEGFSAASSPAAVQQTAAAKPAMPAQPAPAPAPAPKPADVAGTPVKASVPGKIIRLEKAVGDAVKSGDTVLILEAMKMEIPVVAPEDGTISAFLVSPGDAVESGDMLATLS